MFLTLKDFLGHFPIKKISKQDFVNQFTITYSPKVTLEQIYTLKPVKGRKRPIIKDPKTDIRYVQRADVIDYFYEIVIEKRHHYLTKFYEAYFKIQDPSKYKWSGIDIKMKLTGTNKAKSIKINQQDLDHSLSLQRNDKSRVMVRSLFALELLRDTYVTNSVKAKVPLWTTLDNLYNHFILEDRLFAPSSIGLFLREKRRAPNSKLPKEINYNNLFYLMQQYQPKASILNPYSVNWLLKNIFKGKKLFTPVLSWCSYEIAFMHSDWTHYVGVDVMPSACQKAEWLADFYSKFDQNKYGKTKKQVEIYCTPSESLANNKGFLDKYDSWFDTVIICPPYFDMEIYHEGEQSTKNYPKYLDWLEKYWHKTVQVCDHVLKKGGFFGVIVNDYYSLDGTHYPLPKDFDTYTSKYFKLKDIYYLYNRTSPLRVNHKDRTERLYVYTK